MFEKNTPKSGVAPTKKTLGMGSKSDSKTPSRTPSRRVMMNGGAGEHVPPEAKDPNFYFRWCADDSSSARIDEYQEASYEFVLRDGEKIKRPGGIPLFLMKLPIELRNEDILAKQSKIIDINKKVQKESAVNKKGNVPDYIPDGQDSVTERDNL